MRRANPETNQELKSLVELDWSPPGNLIFEEQKLIWKKRAQIT